MATLKADEVWEPNVTAAFARFKEKRAERNRALRRWGLAAGVAATAALGLMFLPPAQVMAHRCLECSIAVWESLSAGGAVQANLKPQSERVTAPDFQLEDANGKIVKLSALKGKVVLVNFWATWCEGCQVEIPWFVEFAKKYEGKGLVVVGVSMDDDGWKSVKPWIREKKVNYTIVIGGQELGKKYGLDGMPLTALVGRDGKIADLHGGVVDKDATETKIRALLGEGGKS